MFNLKVFFSAFFWDPNPIFWKLPLLNHPIAWYGVLFTLGFAISFSIVRREVMRKIQEDQPQLPLAEVQKMASRYVDRALIYSLIGTVVGARLGHILFYHPELFLSHPMEAFKVWHGGLASHGAVVGNLVSLWLFHRYSSQRFFSVSFLRLLDWVTLAAAITAFCIRIGNFINQELVGTASNLPWAIQFGHPQDGVDLGVARHPVQLYEGGAYLVIFFLLYFFFRRYRPPAGIVTGFGLCAIFFARFFLEYFKVPQGDLLPEGALLSMGQILSIPIMLFGLLLVLRVRKKHSVQEDFLSDSRK